MNKDNNQSLDNRSRDRQMTYLVFQPEPLIDDSPSIKDYFFLFVNHKKIVSLVIILFFILSLLVAFTLQPVYRAEAKVSSSIDNSKPGISGLNGQFDNLASFAGLRFKVNSSTEQILAIIRSFKFMRDFLKDNEIATHLSTQSSNKFIGMFKSNSEKKMSEWRAYNKFLKIFNTTHDVKSNVISVSIEWSDPKLASEWVNQIIARLNEHQKNAAVEEAEKSISFLQAQLEETSVVEMQQVLYRLIESQTKVIMLANSREQYALKIIDPAVPPEIRVSPNRLKIVILGTLFGFFTLLLVFAIMAVFSDTNNNVNK